MDGKGCAQPGLRFRLFGDFEASLHGIPIGGLHLRKGERLLAYLALHASRWVDRAELASLFWDGGLIGDPEANLRQSLTYLRPLLGEEAARLETRVGAVRLVLTEGQADTLQLEAACASGDPSSLALAAGIAREPLLAGWKDAWIAPFRERFETMLRAARERTAAGGTFPAGARSGALPAWAAPGPGDAPEDAAGGALPLASARYVARDADATLYAALARQEGIVLLKGARQVGKSSLLARGLHFGRQRGAAVCHTDCDQAAPEDVASRDAFYVWLAASLAEQRDQEFVPAADWKAHLGANGNLERFLRRRVLAQADAPVLWALDGVDRLFRTDYYGEFFALLRGLHTKRATEPDVPWHRLTVLLAAATEAHLYIRDLNQSPFNVGTRIALEDFDALQSAELLRRCGSPVGDDAERALLHDLLGGHPYLLARGLREMAARSLDVAALAELALRPTGPFHDHLEGIVQFVNGDSELQADLRAALDGRPCSDGGFFRLRTAGVLCGDAPDLARPRCGLYARYFARCLR